MLIRISVIVYIMIIIVGVGKEVIALRKNKTTAHVDGGQANSPWIFDSKDLLLIIG